jgi:ribosomal protein L18
MNKHFAQLVQSAYDHIATAHILESNDSDAAFEQERQAWDAAYKVGAQSAAAVDLPALFTASRTLTQAWTKARTDRSLGA